MSEKINYRKRKLSSESAVNNYGSNTETQNSNENELLIKAEQNEESKTSASNVNNSKDIQSQSISNTTLKSTSQLIPSNSDSGGLIVKRISGIKRQTLRIRRSSTKTLNGSKNRNITDRVSSSEDENSLHAARSLKRKRTLQKYCTLKLKKLKEKFRTNHQLKGKRFRTMQTSVNDRFRKDMNQSKIENNKQTKLLEKLLDKHNKHLENL